MRDLIRNRHKGVSISESVGLAKSVISRLWNRLQETWNVRRRSRQGCSCAITATDSRYTSSKQSTKCNFYKDTSFWLHGWVSRQIITKQSEVRLYLCGLYARMPMVCIPLTSRHCMVRKSWANEHRDWTQPNWNHELFTDESRFSL